MVELRRWGPRILAPAAFLLGITVAVMLVRAGMDDDSDAATIVLTATTARTGTTATTGTTTRARPKPVFARIQAGDTLDQIAIEHDTTVERLLALNEDLDPNSLQIGQRIRVR